MNLLLYLNWLQMIFDLSTPVLSKPFIIVQRLSTYFFARLLLENLKIFLCKGISSVVLHFKS